VRCTICAARDTRLASRVTALLGRFLPKLRAAFQAAFFLSRYQATRAAGLQDDSARHNEVRQGITT
jgi:hypothetical protein